MKNLKLFILGISLALTGQFGFAEITNLENRFQLKEEKNIWPIQNRFQVKEEKITWPIQNRFQVKEEKITWPIQLTIIPPDESQFRMPNKTFPKTFNCYYTFGEGFPVESSQLITISTKEKKQYQFKKGEPAYRNTNQLLCFVNVKEPVKSPFYQEITCKNVKPGTILNIAEELKKKNGHCVANVLY